MMSMISSESSALIICLITLDRFIVLYMPFSQIRFRRRSASIAAALTWFIGLCLATVPLTPMTSHWEFFSQTGVCVPLPITRASFAGQNYAFGIFIVLNFVLFLMVAFGQVGIFWAVHKTSKAIDKGEKLALYTYSLCM